MLFRRKAQAALPADGEAIPQAAARAPKEKLGWFEARARRRRRRIIFEEVVGWIVVPAMLYLVWLGYRAIGGVPKEIVDFGNELIGLVMKSTH